MGYGGQYGQMVDYDGQDTQIRSSSKQDTREEGLWGSVYTDKELW